MWVLDRRACSGGRGRRFDGLCFHLLVSPGPPRVHLGEFGEPDVRDGPCGLKIMRRVVDLDFFRRDEIGGP